MGKYKQWLHHQEIGRRLRDQISTYEQERARVQKMAPTVSTNLPELENPIVAALLNFTRAGNKLSNIDVIKAAMPKMDPDLERRRPAPSAATVAPTGEAAANRSVPTNDAVVAGLQARADSIASDPLSQLKGLAGGERANNADANARASQQQPAPAKGPESLGAWFQQRPQSKD